MMSKKRPQLALQQDLVRDDMPAAVIPKLWIGSCYAAFNQEALLREGITHILNASGRVPTFPKKFTYLSVELKDREDANVLSCIPMTNLFIASGIERGGVLVHCIAGRSRSASLIVAFLMATQGYSYDDAVAALRRVRPVVSINCGFERQLRAYAVTDFDIFTSHQMLLRLRMLDLLQKEAKAAKQALAAAALRSPSRSTRRGNTNRGRASPTWGESSEEEEDEEDDAGEDGDQHVQLRHQISISARGPHPSGGGFSQPSTLSVSRSADSRSPKRRSPKRAGSSPTSHEAALARQGKTGGGPDPKDPSVVLESRAPSVRLTRPGSSSVRVIPPLRALEREFHCRQCHTKLFALANVWRPDLEFAEQQLAKVCAMPRIDSTEEFMKHLRALAAAQARAEAKNGPVPAVEAIPKLHSCSPHTAAARMPTTDESDDGAPTNASVQSSEAQQQRESGSLTLGQLQSPHQSQKIKATTNGNCDHPDTSSERSADEQVDGSFGGGSRSSRHRSATTRSSDCGSGTHSSRHNDAKATGAVTAPGRRHGGHSRSFGFGPRQPFTTGHRGAMDAEEHFGEVGAGASRMRHSAEPPSPSRSSEDAHSVSTLQSEPSSVEEESNPLAPGGPPTASSASGTGNGASARSWSRPGGFGSFVSPQADAKMLPADGSGSNNHNDATPDDEDDYYDDTAQARGTTRRSLAAFAKTGALGMWDSDESDEDGGGGVAGTGAGAPRAKAGLVEQVEYVLSDADDDEEENADAAQPMRLEETGPRQGALDAKRHYTPQLVGRPARAESPNTDMKADATAAISRLTEENDEDDNGNNAGDTGVAQPRARPGSERQHGHVQDLKLTVMAHGSGDSGSDAPPSLSLEEHERVAEAVHEAFNRSPLARQNTLRATDADDAVPWQMEKRRWLARVRLLRADSRVERLMSADEMALLGTHASAEHHFYLEHLKWMGEIVSFTSMTGSLSCPSCKRAIGEWCLDGSHFQLENIRFPVFRVNKSSVIDGGMAYDVTPLTTPRPEEEIPSMRSTGVSRSSLECGDASGDFIDGSGNGGNVDERSARGEQECEVEYGVFPTSAVQDDEVARASGAKQHK